MGMIECSSLFYIYFHCFIVVVGCLLLCCVCEFFFEGEEPESVCFLGADGVSDGALASVRLGPRVLSMLL